jgi:hypothetical protein
MRNLRKLLVLAEIAAALAAAESANADVVISSAATSNMSCSGGVCAPTAKDAILNVGDLENLLATGAVEVTTTGSGVQAGNIDIDAALTWSGSSTLALDAYQSILVEKPVSIAGRSGLSVTTNDGGSGGEFGVLGKGRVSFANLSSALTINGASYMLEGDIKSLADAIAANPGGDFALANNYDASADGTYGASPIQTVTTGVFEGLGNAISHLSIDASGFVGLFFYADGSIENFRLVDIDYTVSEGSVVGGLASEGLYLSRVRVTGTIRGSGSESNTIGGIANSAGTITDSSADVRIIQNQPGGSGGLTGGAANIYRSFATGSVTANGSGSIVGGLVSINTGTIQDSYATGAVKGGGHSKVGGLVGTNGDGKVTPGTIETSYSTGVVSAKNPGGFVGVAYKVHGQSEIEQSYWDTTTSGTNQGTGRGNKKGITGLTTQQLQSGLPSGFDPKVWAENPKINNGLPYLINNPPE